MWLPIQTQTAIVMSGLFEIDFAQSNVDRVIQWIALVGPAGSTVSVFVDTVFMDVSPHGDFNRADYYAGIPLARGRTFRLVWSVGTGTPVPTASIGCTDGDAAANAQLGIGGY